MPNTIIRVLPLEDLTLLVWFEPGVTRRFDASTLIRDEKFSSLVDGSVFDRVTVTDDAQAITWGDGMSLDSTFLFEKSEDIDIVEVEKRRLLRSVSLARRSADLSQVKLGEIAGIRQPVISRIESGDIAPQINTLFKLLAPMGKTLTITDLEEL